MAGITEAEKTLLKQLKEPFDPKFVKWRIGSTTKDKTKGQVVAYIDAREVRKRLDDVMGIGNWRKQLTRFDGGFTCRVFLRINGEWIERDDAGEDSNMSPVKGGASDAFKRAASGFGVGAYLYYLPKVWLPIKPQGKSYVIDGEVPELPEWAVPGYNKTERWEDVAEMEADLTSGEDVTDIAAVVISNIDRIREAASSQELLEVIDSMSEADQLILVNEIAIKRRKLEHDAKIHES